MTKVQVAYSLWDVGFCVASVFRCLRSTGTNITKAFSLHRTDDNRFAQALQPHCFAPFSLTVDLELPASNPKGENEAWTGLSSDVFSTFTSFCCRLRLNKDNKRLIIGFLNSQQKLQMSFQVFHNLNKMKKFPLHLHFLLISNTHRRTDDKELYCLNIGELVPLIFLLDVGSLLTVWVIWRGLGGGGL